MSTRLPGSIIRKTPPTITPPSGGEGGSASGVWTLEQATYYAKAGTWPKPVVQKYLFVMGYNANGQLGTNDRADRSSPVQIGTNDWKQVQTGGLTGATAGIKTNGTLWTWGRNDRGQLAMNDRVYRSSPVQVSGTNWSLTSITADFGMAVRSTGTLWAWGDDSNYGCLGLNTNWAGTGRSSPTQVGADTNWSLVCSSFYQTIAQKTDGSIWTWGWGAYGALGNNSQVSRSSPAQVGTATDWTWVRIGTGTGQLIRNGSLFTFGLNDSGQLGHNDRVYRSSPTQVGALTNWSKAVCAHNTLLAVKTDGTLWTWGSNGNGQLGSNTTVARSSPVQVGTATDWSQVSGSGLSSGIGIKTDGTVWAWGLNSNGELGFNDRVNRSSPVQLGALTTWNVSPQNNPAQQGGRNMLLSA